MEAAACCPVCFGKSIISHFNSDEIVAVLSRPVVTGSRPRPRITWNRVLTSPTLNFLFSEMGIIRIIISYKARLMSALVFPQACCEIKCSKRM